MEEAALNFDYKNEPVPSEHAEDQKSEESEFKKEDNNCSPTDNETDTPKKIQGQRIVGKSEEEGIFWAPRKSKKKGVS